jgi:hypothetical protein
MMKCRCFIPKRCDGSGYYGCIEPHADPCPECDCKHLQMSCGDDCMNHPPEALNEALLAAKRRGDK